jgi:nucleoside-diphosphate-sugar epimerase
VEKILLTGATGFLGSHILKRLIEVGENVVILVREKSNTDRIKDLKGFSTFIMNKQFSNIEDLYKKHNINTIIHVATEYGRNSSYSSVLMSNVLFPIRLIELADKNNLKLFINTDTFSSKFQDSSYLKEYISSKFFFKGYLKSLLHLQVFNLQLEHVFGEFDSKGKFVTFLLESMLSNQKSIKLTKGSQKRDFIYVSDVVDAYMIVLKSKHILENYKEFEVGRGFSITVKEFVSKIHSIIGSKSDLLFGALETRHDEIQDSKANNLDLCSLGWKPKFTIDMAIKRILNVINDPL